MTTLTQVSETQAQKATTVNENFTAVAYAGLFGRRAPAISGLTWAYFGGILYVAGVATAIADGTVALTNAATNYVEATTAGVVSANVVGFTSGRIPLYTVTTAGSVITGYTDYRSQNNLGDLVIVGTFTIANGTAAAPSLAFTSDTDTGIYRQGANSLGITANGAEVARFVGAASATRGFTFTNSNGGNPTLDVTGGSLAITPAVICASTLAVTSTSAFTGNITVGGNTVASAKITINGTDASGKFLEYQSAGVVKWQAYSAATTHVWTLDSATVTAISATQAGVVTLASLTVTGTTLHSDSVTIASGKTITLSGAAGQIFGSAGSTASSPSFSINSDGDTGMFSAAANALGFAGAGAEQVRITGTASATRYITLTGSNGGNPTLGVSGGNLAITSGISIILAGNTTFQSSDGTVTTFSGYVPGTGVGQWGTFSAHPAVIITNNSEVMRVFSGGAVSIGTTAENPLSNGGTHETLAVNKASGTSYLSLVTDATADASLMGVVNFGTSGASTGKSGASFQVYLEGSGATNATANMRIFTRGADGFVERSRWTTGGYFKASNSGSYISTTGGYHEFNSNAATTYVIYFKNTHASDPYGFNIGYTATPNGTANEFLTCGDGTATRFVARSNGGLANFSANNVNLSDKRAKNWFEAFVVRQDLGGSAANDAQWTPAFQALWNAHKEMRGVWGRFTYNDQNGDHLNYGYTAQGVARAFENAAPDLVVTWDKHGLLGVRQENLHNITGAIVTELQYRSEEHDGELQGLRKRVTELESQLLRKAA